MSKFFICLSLTEEGKEKNISFILNSFYVLLTELNSDPDLHQNTVKIGNRIHIKSLWIRRTEITNKNSRYRKSLAATIP